MADSETKKQLQEIARQTEVAMHRNDVNENEAKVQRSIGKAADDALNGNYPGGRAFRTSKILK